MNFLRAHSFRALPGAGLAGLILLGLLHAAPAPEAMAGGPDRPSDGRASFVLPLQPAAPVALEERSFPGSPEAESPGRAVSPPRRSAAALHGSGDVGPVAEARAASVPRRHLFCVYRL